MLTGGMAYNVPAITGMPLDSPPALIPKPRRSGLERVLDSPGDNLPGARTGRSGSGQGFAATLHPLRKLLEVMGGLAPTVSMLLRR